MKPNRDGLPARVKLDPTAYRAAMLQQRTVKVKDYPVGNRAARRLAASKKGEKSWQGQT